MHSLDDTLPPPPPPSPLAAHVPEMKGNPNIICNCHSPTHRQSSIMPFHPPLFPPHPHPLPLTLTAHAPQAAFHIVDHSPHHAVAPTPPLPITPCSACSPAAARWMTLPLWWQWSLPKIKAGWLPHKSKGVRRKVPTLVFAACTHWKRVGAWFSFRESAANCCALGSNVWIRKKNSCRM